MHVHAPRISISSCNVPLRTFGSRYGGWTVLAVPTLRGAHIISCGAGEDVTFDVGIADAFDCDVVIVDPTPRAIAHVNDVLSRVGQPAEVGYSENGKQPVEAYDLHRIRGGQLKLLERALWVRTGHVRFYLPRNPSHVSHSIVNIQHEERIKVAHEYIEVPCVMLRAIMLEHGIGDLELLKLDIEGAEIDVLSDMLGGTIRPKQLLVEFDGLNFPSHKATRKVKQVDRLLRAAGYGCYDTNGLANYLYALESEVAKWERGET
jgi:FkbM family methyltransferase